MQSARQQNESAETAVITHGVVSRHLGFDGELSCAARSGRSSPQFAQPADVNPFGCRHCGQYHGSRDARICCSVRVTTPTSNEPLHELQSMYSVPASILN